MACSKPTTEQEWYELFCKFIEGSDSAAEAVKKAQDYIKENYSFSLPDDSTAYVYFGCVDEKIGVWKIVGGLSEVSNGERGFISSTEAGQLFNDRDNFIPAMEKAFARFVKTDGDPQKEGVNILYEGQDHKGEITFLDNSKIISFNDFFSKNYIENLHCENIHAIFAGEPKTRDGMGFNCFMRTELGCILKNKDIKAINGIKKDVFLKPYKDKNYNAYKFVSDILKAAQVKECTRIHFTPYETVVKGEKVTNVDVTYFEIPKDTSKVYFEFIDANVLSVSLAQNNQIGDFSSSYEYLYANYSDSYAYWLGSTLRLGEIEYDMLNVDNANLHIAIYNFDVDKMLLYELQDKQEQRKDHLRSLQNESIRKIAPIDIESRVDITHNTKRVSAEGFDVSRTKRRHFDDNIYFTGKIHAKQDYNNSNPDNNKILVKRKSRASKSNNGPSM